jgi:fatty-acyl-CoA synthase
MIISGGVNIYPQEIESALALHPAVADVAVIGVPHPEMGEEVKAVVQPSADAVPGAELAAELTAYLRGRIAGFKIPRSFAFTAQLPRTPTGKLLKNEVKKAYG